MPGLLVLIDSRYPVASGAGLRPSSGIGQIALDRNDELPGLDQVLIGVLRLERRHGTVVRVVPVRSDPREKTAVLGVQVSGPDEVLCDGGAKPVVRADGAASGGQEGTRRVTAARAENGEA